MNTVLCKGQWGSKGMARPALGASEPRSPFFPDPPAPRPPVAASLERWRRASSTLDPRSKPPQLPWPIRAVPRFMGPRAAFPQSASAHTSGLSRKGGWGAGDGIRRWGGWRFRGMVGGRAANGVGRTREGGMFLEREREAFVLRARTRKDKLGPWEYLSRGWNPAE